MNVHRLAAVRVEPGCLGPTGGDLIDGFCRFAQREVDTRSSDVVVWTLIPRHDKSLPEITYQINGKNLTQEKAARYLAMFSANLDDVEEALYARLDGWIEQYRLM